MISCFARILVIEQHAVGVEAAIEKLAHTMQALLDNHPDLFVLQFDAISAFNNILREEMLQELAVFMPELVSIFAQWMTRTSTFLLILDDGTVEEIITALGIDQGCPGSAVMFAFGMIIMYKSKTH